MVLAHETSSNRNPVATSPALISNRNYALCLLVVCSPFFLFLLAESFLWPGGRAVAYWFIDILGNVVIAGLVLLLASRVCHLSARKIGLLSINSIAELLRLIWICFVCALLLLFVDLFAVSFTRYLVAEFPELLKQNYSHPDNMPKEWPQRGFLMAYFVLTASLVEEVFFRGILREIIFGLIPYGKRAVFVIVSTALFSAIHWKLGFVPFVAAVSIGLLLGVLFVELSDLRPLIVAHAVLDLYWFI